MRLESNPNTWNNLNEQFTAMQLNIQLQELAVGTPCHCQRRSQCTTGIEGELLEVFGSNGDGKPTILKLEMKTKHV